MRIFYPQTLLTELAHSNLFIDTNTFIGAISFPEVFENLIKELKNAGCSYLTIPSVVFEFTRGTESVQDFNKRAKFITDLSSVYPIERYLDGLENLTLVLQKIQGSISYTDFLLLACLYKFPKSFLISANHKDCPLDILDRKFVITVDTDKEIRNYGIYQFSSEKFNKAASSILKS